MATTVQWWASDAIAIPFARRFSRPQALEVVAQAASVLLAIWLVFGFAAANPYQPLYLLFIPLIWIAVRHGLLGAVLAVFAINVGLTLAA